MQHKKLAACTSAVLLALAVACSKSSDTPVSPSSALPAGTEAGPNGETLKASAPAPQSPINGAQPDTLVFTAGKSSATYDQSLASAFSYEFQVLSGNTVVCSATVGGGSGSSVSWTPTCTLDLDTPFTWRVRATYSGANGPWSATANFRSPLGGYLNGNELYDPLYNGKTIGTPNGPVTFTSDGARLEAQVSHVRYQLQTPLPAGEMSLMVKGADEGSPGDKSKIFAMQRGDDFDITTNSYRFTAELRGANYAIPGSISCRMIAGDGVSRDCDRRQRNFDRSRWYFWKVSWNQGGSFTMEVRQDGPRGNVIYSFTHPLNGRVYAPNPHNVYIGSPVGRAGPTDATLPGGTYKNVWVSSRPRPTFPGE